MQEKSGPWYHLYQSLTSIKLSLFVFFILAAASLVGTLLPQGVSEHELHRMFSPGTAQWIETLGLNDLYHTRWFRFLLLILCVNLIACSIDRLPKILKLIKHREDRINPQKLLNLSYSRQLSTKISWTQAEQIISKTCSDQFAPVNRLDNPDEYNGIAEKGRWSPLMVYVVHMSVLLIIFGALLGSTLGFKGFMNLNEGEASDQVILSSGHASVLLPFQIRCDDFNVTFYDTGAPKEFRSDLTVLSNGNEVLKQTIRVNDPLTYEGVTFYQSSYGTSLKEAEVELQDKTDGRTFRLTLPYREMVTIPGTQEQIQIAEYQQNLSGFGPALGIVLQKEGQESTGSWILAKMPEFHGNRVQNYQVKVLRSEETQYTGLQVKRDPGIWMVYAGFTAMLIGIGLAFYTSHRKIWVWALPGEKSSKIIIAGRASKNPLAFEEEFNRVCDRLATELKAEPIKRK